MKRILEKKNQWPNFYDDGCVCLRWKKDEELCVYQSIHLYLPICPLERSERARVMATDALRDVCRDSCRLRWCKETCDFSRREEHSDRSTHATPAPIDSNRTRDEFGCTQVCSDARGRPNLFGNGIFGKIKLYVNWFGYQMRFCTYAVHCKLRQN